MRSARCPIVSVGDGHDAALARNGGTAARQTRTMIAVWYDRQGPATEVLQVAEQQVLSIQTLALLTICRGARRGDIDQKTWRSLRDRDGQARRLSDLRVGAQPTSVTFFAWSNGGTLRLTAAVDSPARNR